MSDETPNPAIEDEDLPEDLQPSDDNPLAKPLTDEDDAPAPEDLDVLGGKAPEESGGSEDGSSNESDDTHD